MARATKEKGMGMMVGKFPLRLRRPNDYAGPEEFTTTGHFIQPDVFFKALYPNYIGPDTKEHIKRIQAKELQVIDLTEKPQKSKVLKYPQPIPY